MIALCSELWCNFTFARVIFNFFTNDDDEDDDDDDDDDDDEFRNLDPRRASSRVKISGRPELNIRYSNRTKPNNTKPILIVCKML